MIPENIFFSISLNRDEKSVHDIIVIHIIFQKMF